MTHTGALSEPIKATRIRDVPGPGSVADGASAQRACEACGLVDEASFNLAFTAVAMARADDARRLWALEPQPTEESNMDEIIHTAELALHQLREKLKEPTPDYSACLEKAGEVFCIVESVKNQLYTLGNPSAPLSPPPGAA